MDSFVLQENGQYLLSANNINAPLQFGQLIQPSVPPRIHSSRPHNLLQPLPLHHRWFHGCASWALQGNRRNRTRLAPYSEWLGPYNPNRRAVGDPNYLVNPEVFDWNDSTPAAQAAYMVRALQDLQFELDDAVLLAVDFARCDYRDLTSSAPLSIWIPYFIGLYTLQGTRVRRRDY
jgi:hypothetical protein